MDLDTKLELLGEASQYDLCGEQPAPSAGLRQSELSHCISKVQMPGGCKKVLKVLLSSFCDNNCAYCALRSSRDFPRTAMTSEELARGFDSMQRAGLVEGLFLSSGIGNNPVREMDRMLATVEIVRQRFKFRGYVHLKLLPGATSDQIAQAIRLVDRVSTNLEAPNAARLKSLSPDKVFDSQLLANLRTATRLVREAGRGVASGGVTTQFVVGAAGENDLEILNMSWKLYRQEGLRRAYYSAFSPIRDTPLENHPQTPAIRQHRLYQSDYLLRFYGYRLDELVFSDQGNLPLTRDPKVAWARAHPEFFPIEINSAGREMLLRIPGIGPTVANRLLQERRRRRLSDLSQLSKMGVRTERAAPFILLYGKHIHHQLSFWDFNDAETHKPAT